MILGLRFSPTVCIELYSIKILEKVLLMVTVVYVSYLPDDIALLLKLKEVSDRTLGVTFM